MNEPTCLSCDEDCDYAGHPHPGQYACIKHPQARSYLNREIVKELELRKCLAASGIRNGKSIRLYDNMINLLKEGVKK